MPNTSLLGGRLPLLAQDDLSEKQKPVYQRMRAEQVPWAARHNFEGMTDDERLIGPFNPILYSPEVGTGFLDFETAEGRSTSLDERVRQVVILSVGSVWQSAYETYAHAAVARHVGLSEETIRALENGEVAKDLTGKEQLAQKYTLQLTSRHSVDAVMYVAAERAFGRQGMVDIAFLIGRYLTICTLLNSFDVPRPTVRRAAVMVPAGTGMIASGVTKAADPEPAETKRPSDRMDRLGRKYVFDDKSMDLFFVIALAWGYDGGLDVGAAYYIASQIKDGDADSWVAAFADYGDQQHKLAEEWAAQRWKRQTAEVRLKAFASYRSAWQFAPVGPVFDGLYAKCKSAFRTAMQEFGFPATFFDTPYQGKTLPGVYLQNPNASVPVVLIVGGADTGFEEIFITIGRGIFESGYSVAMVDLPGQGITMHDGFHWEAETEKPISAHIDCLIERYGAQPKRLALIGYSLGGYFACRAAGYEQRLAAVIASTPGGPKTKDALAYLVEVKNAAAPGSAAARNLEIFYWKAGASNDQEFVTKTAGFVSDPSLVMVPFLSVAGTAEGSDVQAGAKEWHEKIRSKKKKFVLLDGSTGADGHVQAANRLRLVQEACGWMDFIFNP